MFISGTKTSKKAENVLTTLNAPDDHQYQLTSNTSIKSNTALVRRDHFNKNSTHIVPQPPYSPDLAPCDFWLFSKLKRPLRGHRFDTIEEIQAESKKALKAILEIEFNKCFDDWKKRWHKCIISGGDYFEGDEIKLDKLIKIFHFIIKFTLVFAHSSKL